METQPPNATQEEFIDEVNPFKVLRDPLVVHNKGTPYAGLNVDNDIGTDRSRWKCALCKGHSHNNKRIP